MKIDEVERQIANQCSAIRAFPSQTPSLEMMFSGENQRAAVQMQIEAIKLAKSQDIKADKINVSILLLLDWVNQYNVAITQREAIEEKRYVENTRLSRIAAWSSVASIAISMILAAISFYFR